MSVQPTHHALPPLGAKLALKGQIQFADATNGLIFDVTFFLMTMMANALTAISQAMSQQLAQDAQNQQNFVNEWAGDPNDNGAPVDPNDPNDHDSFHAAQQWLYKYGASAGLSFDPNNFFDIISFLDWWQHNNGSPHKNISEYLDNFHEQYTNDQIAGQNKTSAAQRPVNTWNQSISDFNKTVVSDYEMMKSFLSIFQNLNAKTTK